MLHPLRPLLLPLLCACLLTGCAASTTPPATSKAPCTAAYTFAPGNYIIDLASGSEVVLDPLMHDFPLFCTPEETQNALELALANRQLPEGDWRVYRLGGDFDDLASGSASRGYMLKRMAPLTDWVSGKK